MMISGRVNENREAVISLTLIGLVGEKHEIEAVIDTGFSGDLTLPDEVAASLGLTWLGREPGVLADGSTDLFDVYAGSVVWNGEPRVVEVAAANAQPLVGMNLLHGHSLRIDVVVDGHVEIAEL